jgi:isoquinoline 1-oxidoreductase beta subunit
MTTALPLSRRHFLASATALAGGFQLGFTLAPALADSPKPELNAWVVIAPDESVTIRIARMEMGQGTLTGLAQLVAEELECDWSKVRTEYPTPGQNLKRNRVWGNFATGGSRGIRDSHDYVRKGGAAARMMLVSAAAKHWGVPESDCTVSKGIVTHKASNRSLSYGQLAQAAALIEPPKDIVLKDPKNWTIAGKPLPRLDTRDKVTGAQLYSMDYTMPGLLHAAIKNCPIFGGKLKSYDAKQALTMKGVKKVVTVADKGVAVVADNWWRAQQALETITIVWDEGPNAKLSSASIETTLKEGLEAQDAVIGNQSGDAKAAFASAHKIIEAEYSYPYQHHATMEPMNATVLYTPEKCEAWTSTQNAETALAALAKAAGLPAEQCDIHRMLLGGGFGRRAVSHDYVEQAALIAKQMPGVPVKLIWSREEDMLHGHYHPITRARMKAGLDAQGNVTALHMRISGQSIMASINANAFFAAGRDPSTFQGLNPAGTEGVFGYAIPNLLIDHAIRNPPIPAGYWRGVNNNQNALYLESFIDELAQATGSDPLAFRQKLLAKSPQHLAVLNAVADKAEWHKPAPKGIYRGLAQHMGYGSYVAACAEVSVTGNKIQIHRIVAATNPGHAVNPQQIMAQIEGSFAYGLSALFYGEITLKDGKVEQENFDTYEILRMAQMPKVESIVMPSGGFWGGVGEPTIFVAAPAVLNAIAAATGKRLRTMPIQSHSDLKIS